MKRYRWLLFEHLQRSELSEPPTTRLEPLPLHKLKLTMREATLTSRIKILLTFVHFLPNLSRLWSFFEWKLTSYDGKCRKPKRLLVIRDVRLARKGKCWCYQFVIMSAPRSNDSSPDWQVITAPDNHIKHTWWVLKIWLLLPENNRC